MAARSQNCEECSALQCHKVAFSLLRFRTWSAAFASSSLMLGKLLPKLASAAPEMSAGKSAARSNATPTSPQNAIKSPTEFVILGSGVSTAIPRISCVIRDPYGCKVCARANEDPNDKNRRCNVSALVRVHGKTVLIDCGKTTREATMRHFRKLGVSSVDSIVLTHGHADAVLGLDDCRDIQHEGKEYIVDGKSVWTAPDPTPVFLNEETMEVCQRVFPYLVPEEQRLTANNEPNKKQDIQRRVAALDWKVYSEDKYFKPFYPVEDSTIEFTPFPMLHGGTYICMGFLIKIREDDEADPSVIAYLSDLHELPERSLAFLKQEPKIDLLVVDLLTKSTKNKSHFHYDQAIDMVKELRPTKAVAVGMTCSIGLHDDVNKELAKLDSDTFNFRLAYDGMRFPMA